MSGMSRDIPRVEAEFAAPLMDVLTDLYVSKCMSTQEVAVKLGVTSQTVNKWRRKCKIEMRPRVAHRKYQVRSDYFRTIDSPLKAYLLGFIAADGYVVRQPSGSGYLGINLQERDREVLELLKEQLGTSTPITAFVHKFKGKLFGRVRIQVGSTVLVDDLEPHGIHPRKSWSLMPPTTVPKGFVHDYVRGFFDGDGGVAVGKGNPPIQVYFCGTPEMMTWLTEVFKGACGVPPNKVIMRTERFATLTYGGSKAVAIRDYMYHTGTEFGLSRKKAKLFSVAPKGVVAEVYLQRAFG